MGLQNVSSGRIDAAVFLLTYAIGEIASRRASGIGWDIGHRFLLGGGSHGLTVVEGVLDGFLDAVNVPEGDAEYSVDGGAVVPLG